MCDRIDALRADLAEVDTGLEGALHRIAEAGHEVNVPQQSWHDRALGRDGVVHSAASRLIVMVEHRATEQTM
jgi:hypothetical protein